jgi:hypothetical protein
MQKNIRDDERRKDGRGILMEQELKTHDQKVWPVLVLKEEDKRE